MISTDLMRIAFLCAVIAVGAAPVEACACVMSPGACPDQTLRGDDVFLGTVISMKTTQVGFIGRTQIPDYRTAVTLRVAEHFRGSAAESIVVEIDNSDCAYPFKIDHEYLVFAYGYQSKLRVDRCTATRPAKMSAATILQLRADRDKTPLPGLFGFVGTHPPFSNQEGWEQIQPVPGLKVTARSDQQSFETRTAPDGAYAFRGIPKGQYKLSVEAPPDRVALSGSETEVGADGGLGTSCPLNFEIFHTGRIAGVVADHDGNPVSGYVFAEYIAPEKREAFSIESDVKDGSFEIGRLPPGRYRLFFQSASPPRRLIYYPGKLIRDEATSIGLDEGQHIDGLKFTVN
jgi:Carboxypeptidase regulatory-like domain